jgi:hypothetical protein
VTGGQTKKNPGDWKERDEEIIPSSFFAALFPAILPALFRARKNSGPNCVTRRRCGCTCQGPEQYLLQYASFAGMGNRAAVLFLKPFAASSGPGADQFAVIITPLPRCRAR